MMKPFHTKETKAAKKSQSGLAAGLTNVTAGWNDTANQDIGSLGTRTVLQNGRKPWPITSRLVETAMKRILFVALTLGWLMRASSISPAANMSADQAASSTPGPDRVRQPFGLIIHGGAGSLKRKNPETIQMILRQALDLGYGQLACGSNAMDVVAAVLAYLEDTGKFNAGKGAVPNHAGRYELDAAIMLGNRTTNALGSVVAVSRVKNPILLARDVAIKSPRVMLAGRGAEQFARANGYSLVSQKYFDTNEKRTNLFEFLRKEKLKTKTAKKIALRSAAGANAQAAPEMGTIGCCALDQEGNLSAGTSTGGILGKMVGRVGDSPTTAGTWARNETCAVSCTGVGEYFVRANAAADVSARMEYEKKSVREAVPETLANIGKIPGGVGGIIAMDRNGNVAFDFDTPQMPTPGTFRAAMPSWLSATSPLVLRNASDGLDIISSRQRTQPDRVLIHYRVVVFPFGS